MGIRGADNVPLAYVLSASSSDPTPDAQLIAAAPELLEALEETLFMLLAWHEDMPDQVGHKEAPVVAKARATIAKATGKNNS